MSGIAGIIRFDGSQVQAGLIEAMTREMDCRGPDGISHWNQEGVALGHCLLQTTPESLEEKQPVVSEDGTLVLVMDGRVDNWIELRRDLLAQKVILRNSSDSELVLKAYQVWGKNSLGHIEGDFAFAVWDTQKRSLFCARDPLGNKPFNYFWTGSALYFASDLHAVLSVPDIPQVLNEGVLAEFLACEWYSRDETFWRGVQRLVAAHCMVVDPSGPKIEKYWAPELFTTLSYSRDEEYVEHYRELFTDTVRRLSRAHRVLSSEVSGGLDSSSIFVTAEYLRQNNQLLAPDLAGLTMNFEGEPDADEIAFCRAVGVKSGKSIQEVAPSSPPLDWYRERARKFKDFPGYPNGVMAEDLMRQVSGGGGRVLLNGVGGDEWLGASRIYYSEELARRDWKQLMALFNTGTLLTTKMVLYFCLPQTLLWGGEVKLIVV